MPSAVAMLGLTSAGRAQEDDVAGLGEVAAGSKRGDVAATQPGLVVEHELLEGLGGGEAGSADPQLRTGGVAGGDFSVEDGDQVVLMSPAGVSSLGGQPRRCFADPGGFQGGGEVADLLGRVVHEATSAAKSTPNARS